MTRPPHLPPRSPLRFQLRATALLAALALVLVGCIAAARLQQPAGRYGDLELQDLYWYIAWTGLAGAAYAVGVALTRWRPARFMLPVILAAALAARLVVLFAPPVQSTDLYRYVWDGRVQAAGINPYIYLPIDPALAPLRDPGLGATHIYENINRADTARTIYPPAAQLLFAAIGLTSSSIWTVKAAMLGFDLATIGLALLMLRAAGRPLCQVLIWAWNPLVIWEYAGAGHVDAMAVAFTALALLLAIRARAGWASFALSVAVLAKLLPLALFPAIWRRWNLRIPLVAAVTIAAGYAIYAGAGWHVFGYLGGYTEEEQLQDGGGYLLLRLLRLAGPLPAWIAPTYIGAGLVLLAATALLIARRPLPAAPAARAHVIGRGALILSGALVAVMSPHYPWYLTMLVLPAVLCPAWSALWPTLAGPLLYLDFARVEVLWPAIVFLPSLALLLPDILLRTRAPVPAMLVEGGP